MSSIWVKLFAASFGALAFIVIMIFGVIIPAPFEEGKKKIIFIVLLCGIVVFALDAYRVFFLNT